MSDPTNTDASTANMDAQTTPDAGGTPLAPGAAVVTLPDGSAPPVGDDGLPIVSAADDDEENDDAPTEPVGHRLGSRSGMSGYRGLAAKRAERAARRGPSAEEVAAVAPDTDEERAAALALAAEKGYTEADLVDSDGNPLDVAGIHRSLQVEGAEDGDDGAGDDSGSDDDSTPDAAAEAAEDDDAPEGDEPEEVVVEEVVEEVVVEDEPADEPATDEGFDPSAHTVTEVQAYLGEHPDQATYVLDRERAGKARVTLIGA
ncbi:hypothetical protein QDA04_gp23 [Microbacterium phage Megan]|uniref:Uncharacterized protein n=1 Tax=Microbacterium phage Megan TaxID=2656551 RepID=A0A649VLX7_9CAUD|nr:hypothetical protein QDA04_gp23 [Microbacterium phage Megan]QGJ92693.1 hypothetical protein PBI_MEGAN_23 [Microbacterium phage Megan]